jgi:hypothetical protein
MLSEPDSVRSIASGVLTDKAIELLVAIAKGEAPPREEVGDESDDESETGVAEAKSDDELGSTEELDAVQAEAEETPVEVGEESDDESETVVAEAKSDGEPSSTEELEVVQAEAEEIPVEEFESSQAETEEPLVAEVDSASDAD